MLVTCWEREEPKSSRRRWVTVAFGVRATVFWCELTSMCCLRHKDQVLQHGWDFGLLEIYCLDATSREHVRVGSNLSIKKARKLQAQQFTCDAGRRNFTTPYETLHHGYRVSSCCTDWYVLLKRADLCH